MHQDLIETVDRAWRTVIERPTSDQFARLILFLEGLRRDSRTSLVLDDIRTSELDSVAKVNAATETARIGLWELLHKFRGLFVESWQGRDMPDHLEAYLSGDTQTAEPLRVVIHALRRAIEELRLGLEARIDRNNPSPSTDDEWAAWRQLEGALVSIDALYSYARRQRKIEELAGPGAALESLERDLLDVHPPASRLPGPVQDSYFKRIRYLYFDPVQAMQDERLAIMEADRLMTNARVVYEEVRRRLDLERSVLSLFYRYKQRCEWFEAEELRTLANSNVRADGPEARLTNTLARHLFDQGFTPLTKPMFGNQQPDILGPGNRFSFYVEAKQYEASARGYLVDGIAQTWAFLDQIRGTAYDVREAFYVVYRRHGPRSGDSRSVPFDRPGE